MIGMVFHVSDKNHRFFLFGKTFGHIQLMHSLKAEYPLKFVYHGGHPRTGSDDYIIGARIHMVFYFLMSKVVGFGHQRSRFAGLGMRITHKGTESVGNLLLNGSVKPSTGNPVGVKDFFYSERRNERLIDANNIFSELLKIVVHSSTGLWSINESKKYLEKTKLQIPEPGSHLFFSILINSE